MGETLNFPNNVRMNHPKDLNLGEVFYKSNINHLSNPSFLNSVMLDDVTMETSYSAELSIIISYIPSASRIIALLKTPQNIEN